MYINSPGGAVTAGLAIYDTMQYIRSPISTICMGQAASMGSLLLAAGAKGERRSLPNATIMIHQPSGGYSGQAKDMTIHTKQIVRVWDALNALYSKHTGQSVDVIQKIKDRDYFMTLEEAKEFGIIDEVIDQRRYCNYLLSLLLNHHQRRAIQQVHSQLITTNSISHNLINFLLRQYSLSDFPQEAFSLYRHLQHQNQPIFFDSFSFSFLIKSCANSQDSTTGSLFHSLTTKSGFGIHVYVQTALVNMYVACGSLGEAKKVFEEMPSRNSVTWNVLITGLTKWGEISQARALFDVMPDKNVVSWTGIIDGYARMNQADEALSLFRRMMREGIKHSELTMLVIFPAIWNIGCLELCQSIHAYGEKNGFNVSDIRVTNSLIDAYAKCGSVESALKFFECISEERKNLVSWTSIISGCAMYGMTKEAVDNFEEMKNVGFKPNRIAFVSILNACSHGGLVDEGLEFFRNMVNECGIVPDIKHYGCLVDMLGRAGRLEEAENMVMDIPTEMVSDVIWRTLLGACSFHGNAEMGERVLGKILKMEKESAGDYVLLSNIFIGAGRYTDSERVRRVMDERNASKVPGLSLI